MLRALSSDYPSVDKIREMLEGVSRHRSLRLYHFLFCNTANSIISYYYYSNYYYCYYYYYHYYYGNRNTLLFFFFCNYYHSPWSITFYESFSRPLPDRRSTRRLKCRCNEPTSFCVCTLFVSFFSLLRSYPTTLVSLVTRRLRGATSANGGAQRDGGISPLPACLSLYRFFHFYIVIDIS